MTLWCTQRIIIVVGFSALAVILVVLFSLYALMGLSKLNEVVPIPGGKILYIIMAFLAVPVALMLFEVRNFGRVTNYYEKFDEFNKRASKILTREEISELEKDEKPTT